MDILNEIEKLRKSYKKYSEDKSVLECLISENNMQIDKITEEIQLLNNKKNNDISFIDNLNNNVSLQINEKNNIIDKLKNQNKENYNKIVYLEKIIYSLETSINLSSLLESYDHNSELIFINENDRHRIARDLHDITVQNLVHLIHKIDIASKFINKDPVKARLELNIIKKLLKDNINDIRDLIYNLRPMTFDDLGFDTTLSTFLDNINATSGIHTSCIIDADLNNYDDLFLITLFRIIQECCVNSVKHSKANNILVEIKLIDDILNISIKDDGIGLPEDVLNDDSSSSKDDRHFGIKIVKERVSLLSGVCEFISEKGGGLTIQIEIP